VYEDSPNVLKMQLRQRNRLAMSGSGSITLPSPLKRGDGFDALAAKMVLLRNYHSAPAPPPSLLLQISYEQHSSMLMTLPDIDATVSPDAINHDPSNFSSSGRSSPLCAVPTLQPAPCARSSARAGGLAEGLGGRSRPSSALSSSGSGSRPPSLSRPLTPACDGVGSQSASVACAAEFDAAAAATAAALVMAAMGNDDVRASVSMVEPILHDSQQEQEQEQEQQQLCTTEAHEAVENGPTLHVPLP
jgi:hypothetical protein